MNKFDKELDRAARDILSAVMHTSEPRYEEVIEAIVGRLRRLIEASASLGDA